MSREVLVSKKLSWLLRHGAEREGLTLGPGGYVNLKDAVSDLRFLFVRIVLTMARCFFSWTLERRGLMDKSLCIYFLFSIHRDAPN